MSVKSLPQSDEVEVSIRMPAKTYRELLDARRVDYPAIADEAGQVELILSILLQRYINDRLYGDE